MGEVVVVDDGSTDDTARVVAELCSGTTALNYLKLEHTNKLGLLRQAGIEHSKGSIIALLDADDLWVASRVEKQLAAWNKRPTASYAFCNIQRFDENGPFDGGPWLQPGDDYCGRIVRELLIEPVALPSALMFDRAVYDSVGPYSDRPINEDFEWLLEAAYRFDASYVPEPLVLMRAHAGSRSRAQSMRALTEYLSIVRRFISSHPELSSAERQAARAGMANVYVKLSGLFLQSGGRRKAARAAARAILLKPVDRRGYGLLAAAARSKKSPHGGLASSP